MSQPGSSSRDLATLTVLEVGRVGLRDDGWWTALGADGSPLPGVDGFVDELQACGCSRSTARSYCHDLLRWSRFLDAVGVEWRTAGRAEVRDYVRWLKVKANPQRARRGSKPRAAAGSVNPATGKRYLGQGYAPRTINHSLAVLAAFYDYAVYNDTGPLVNPVPGPSRSRTVGRRAERRTAARALYRQREPIYAPRAVSEEMLQALFAALRSDRDRAMVAVTLSTGVRASELLSMTVGGIDAGRSVMLVTPKGRDSERVWVPAAPESLVWISRYLQARSVSSPEEALWMTERAPQVPLTYWGLRMVLERVNAKLGTNYTWHDFRHTFSERLLADKSLSLVEVQHLMRHRSLTTLAPYAASRLEDMVTTLHEHLARPKPEPVPGLEFDAADMKTLFPGLEL